MRDLAAIQEAVLVEQEVSKGDAGHPTVTGRADLLRNDIWDRWRAGEGLPPLTTPLTDAIGKLAEVADRQQLHPYGDADGPTELRLERVVQLIGGAIGEARLEADADAETKIVEVLARVAQELKKM